MSASLTTLIDNAQFDDNRYAFDLDTQHYVPISNDNSQFFERVAGQRLVRTSP